MAKDSNSYGTSKLAPAKGLKIHTVPDLIKGQKIQAEKYKWDFTLERNYDETLLSNRLNFFIIFYALFVAGAFQTNNHKISITLLIIGAIISLLQWAAILRQYKKWLIIVKICYRLPDHALEYQDKEFEATKSWTKNFKQYIIYVYCIPAICCISFILIILIQLLN